MINTNKVICTKVDTKEELKGNTYMITDKGIELSKDLCDNFEGGKINLSYKYPTSNNQDIIITVEEVVDYIDEHMLLYKYTQKLHNYT